MAVDHFGFETRGDMGVEWQERKVTTGQSTDEVVALGQLVVAQERAFIPYASPSDQDHAYPVRTPDAYWAGMMA